MINEDLKTLQKCRAELFEGIKRVLTSIGLEHFQIVGLELEPSSIKTTSNQPELEKGEMVEINERLDCRDGYVSRRVLRVDPRTGQSYYIYICVPDDRVM